MAEAIVKHRDVNHSAYSTALALGYGARYRISIARPAILSRCRWPRCECLVFDRARRSTLFFIGQYRRVYATGAARADGTHSSFQPQSPVPSPTLIRAIVTTTPILNTTAAAFLADYTRRTSI